MKLETDHRLVFVVVAVVVIVVMMSVCAKQHYR